MHPGFMLKELIRLHRHAFYPNKYGCWKTSGPDVIPIDILKYVYLPKGIFKDTTLLL